MHSCGCATSIIQRTRRSTLHKLNLFPRNPARYASLMRAICICSLVLFAAVTYVSASTYDGPAELPRVYVQSALANTPSPGKTWSVSAGGSVQQAINSASCGDTIMLQAGATFTTWLTLPAKACDNQHWIT